MERSSVIEKARGKCLEAAVDVVKYNLQIPRFETEYDHSGMTAEGPRGAGLSIPVNMALGAFAASKIYPNDPEKIAIGVLAGMGYSCVTYFTSAFFNSIRKR